MKSFQLFIALLVATTAAHAGDTPSAVVDRFPVALQPKNCTAVESLLAAAGPHAAADVEEARQGGPASLDHGGLNGAQRELVQRFTDPAVSRCEAMAGVPGEDIAATFEAKLATIRAATDREIDAKCPVIGAGDYRAESCVTPIWRRGIQKERAALADYITYANFVFKDERRAWASCAQTREQLAAQADELPGDFVALAGSMKVHGWQQLDLLAGRYLRLCKAAATAADEVASRARF